MEFPGGARRYGGGVSREDLAADLQELAEAHTALEQQNFHNEVHMDYMREQHDIEHLTGLKTREVFERSLAKTLDIITGKIKERRQPPKELSIVLIDLDHFKNVNDTLGHAAGDAVLVEVAKIIKESVRESDVAARWGGEELVVLMPGASAEIAARQAESIRSKIEHASFKLYPGLKVTASLGVVSSEVSTNSDELKAMVDKALYKVKDNGRNGVNIYTEE